MRKLFILFFALFYMGSVRAEVLYYYSSLSNGLYSSESGACIPKVPASTQDYVYTFKRMGAYASAPDKHLCVWNRLTLRGLQTGANDEVNGGYVSKTTAADCPSGQVRTEGAYPAACGVKPPEEPEGPKCDTPAGKVISWTQIDDDYPKTSPNCKLKDIPSVTGCFKKNGVNYCNYEGESSGENAPAGTPGGSGVTPESTDPQTSTSTGADDKGACPRGTVAAGVDSGGTVICIGTGTNPGGSTKPTPTSTTSKNTDAAGNVIETTTTSQANSDGSTTTTTVTTTTGTDGSKTVSGSTTTGATSAGTAGQEDKSNDICKANPNLTICRNSTVSGTCGQTACTGDAIQCATLRAAAAMRCAQEADEKEIKASGYKTLGDQIMSGSDPMKGEITSLLKGKEIDMSRPNIDQNGFLGGGACIANKSFTVMGQTVTMEFDRICNDIQPIRAVIMLLAFVAAYSIVVRTVLSM